MRGSVDVLVSELDTEAVCDLEDLRTKAFDAMVLLKGLTKRLPVHVRALGWTAIDAEVHFGFLTLGLAQKIKPKTHE